MSDLAQKINERLKLQGAPEKAVSAVLNLHRPRGGYTPPDSWYGNRNECDSCSSYELVAGVGARGALVRWPCPTVRTLASALGVREDGED